MAELPIVVLAFANDQEGHQYLRELRNELRSLQEIFENAEQHGLCRLKLLPNADLGQILKVFTENRDLVTILHVAGHADSGRLLLESSDTGVASANAAGLATFLGQRRGLQLVFLNGCSTRAQVVGLLDAGLKDMHSVSGSNHPRRVDSISTRWRMGTWLHSPSARQRRSLELRRWFA